MHHTIIILGNLGRDPELRYTPSGQSVCSFSVASEHSYSNSAGEKIKETIWFRVSTWGKQAEVCNQYLHKGNKVYIEGRLTPDKKTGNPRIWDNKGEPAASFEVVASTVRFLSPKTNESQPEEVEGEVPF